MIGRVISHYTVLERLGGGGMGVVYKAIDTRLDRHVALKFLSPETNRDENSKKRFMQEARAASALDHSNICTIYEIDETDDGHLFIAMAYYEGETLRRRIEDTALTVSKVAHIAGQIASGLSKAHASGIVHRDIKPANVIITKDETVKIVDFGLAKLTGNSELTRSGSTVGTAAYMSPEQAQGLTVDHRTDIWSWGVVLYEMLTGQTPFRAENHVSLFHAIVEKDPAPVSQIRSSLSSGFDELIAKVLHKNPEKRFPSILEASEELQRLAATTGVSIFTTRSIPLATEATISRVEKKQIAILKSEIGGYADLLEYLSSAELQAVLRKLQGEIEQIANSYGGIVNEFSGEQITLVFGIPTADEHDVIRAAYASIEIHKAVRRAGSDCQARTGNSLTVQSGIATGVVVVRPSGSPDRKCELTGSAIGTASTLASHAEAGEVWIPEEMRRPLERFFITQGCEEIYIKGKSKLLKPYKLLAQSAESRFDVWSKEELSPYAGREKELDLLQDKLESACRGEGQFVAIIGEAGSGKSRLLYEFRKRLDPLSIRILQGGSHVYAANVAYSPFIELLREDLKLREKGNSEQVAVEQIKQLDQSLMDFLPVYLHLLAIPTTTYPLPKHFTGKELQPAITEALCAFMLCRRDGPVVLLLEDWHAADEASKNILEQQQEMIPDDPILLVVTCRPECSFRPAAHHTTIYLKPLDGGSSKVIMQSALEADNIPSKLVDLVVERTGGNPFFIEEICQNLREENLVKVENRTAILTTNLERFRLPDTVQSVIGGRLDRIDADGKRILETASVIGREFNRSLLLKLSGDETRLLQSLEVLKGLGLIQQLRFLPEASYKFKHPLIQETAYERLLGQERKQIHGAVGDAIEELYADRLEENLDVLAHHFSMAERWEKAVHYGRAAARKASSVADFNAALLLLERVEEWLAKLPDDPATASIRIELALDQERLCETLGIRDRQEAILTSVISILNAGGNRSLLMEAYRRLGELYTVVAKFGESENALNESLRLSLELADAPGERNAHRSKGFLYWNEGRNEEAIASNERALAIDRQRNDIEGLGRDLLNLTSILRGMGRYEEALECGEEALKHFETVDDPVKRATAVHVIASIHRDSGNDDLALEYFEKALEISSFNRLVVIQSFQVLAIAHVYSQRGRREEALKMLQHLADLCRKSGYAEGLAHSMRAIGELLLDLKEEANALSAFEEAASLFFKLKDATNAALMYGNSGAIYEKAGRIADAVRAWETAKDLREKTGDKQGLFVAAETLGRLSRQQEDFASAVKFYAQAADLAVQEDAKGSLLYTLGILEWKRRNYSTALTHFRAALSLFEKLGDSVHSGLMWNSIGVTLKEMGEREQALKALRQAIELNRQTKQRLLEGHALSALGQIFYESGEWEKAAECCRDSLEIRKQIGDRKGEAWMIYQLGLISVAQKSDADAGELFSQAALIAEECGDNELILACKKAYKQ
jgi:serine/threonine protein kinase/tetratricopeptide (TPR) repeat protein